MKSIFLTVSLFIFKSFLFSQQADSKVVENVKELLLIKCDSTLKMIEQKGEVIDGNIFTIVFEGTEKNIIKYFKNSILKLESGSEKSLFQMLVTSNSHHNTNDETAYVKSEKIEKGNGFQVSIPIPKDNYGDEKKFVLNITDGGTNKQVATIEVIKPSNKEKGKIGLKDVTNIIADSVLTSVSKDAECQLCDTWAKDAPLIGSKKDRRYSTDYIVVYDASLKKDAYTICKHIFEKQGDSLKERYIKIGAMWFAPSVGSQIRFEVINQPLTKPMTLSVDEIDVFNGGAAQFSSIITSLVNAQIVNPIVGGDTAKGDSEQAWGPKPDSISLEQAISDASNQILAYVSLFRISSCSIELHRQNYPKILAGLNKAFGVQAGSIDQFSNLVRLRIEKEIVKPEDKLAAQNSVAAIVEAMKKLENVEPIAYTTLRAKNRDFIEVKYATGSNRVSKPEYIRMSGGMKIDFSAGFVLTGLKDYSYIVRNEKVSYDPDDSTSFNGGGNGVLSKRDTTGNVISFQDNGSKDIGVSILTHFYPRISSHYNLGGAVGLMTSTNLNLRLMLGGSFIVSSLFGSNNRISFTGGVVYGKVKRLGLQDEAYLDKPSMVNGIPNFYTGSPTLVDKTEKSWFFSVNFNFGGN